MIVQTDASTTQGEALNQTAANTDTLRLQIFLWGSSHAVECSSLALSDSSAFASGAWLGRCTAKIKTRFVGTKLIKSMELLLERFYKCILQLSRWILEKNKIIL